MQPTKQISCISEIGEKYKHYVEIITAVISDDLNQKITNTS